MQSYLRVKVHKNTLGYHKQKDIEIHEDERSVKCLCSKENYANYYHKLCVWYEIDLYQSET